MKRKGLKVLFVTSEMVPYAKTGGLADVSGSLPLAILKNGIDIRVVLPKYKNINEVNYNLKYLYSLDVVTSEGLKKVNIFKHILKKLPVYIVGYDDYFKRNELYGTKEYGDYPDNLKRFVLFCKSALEVCIEENFIPDIIHCNDWQTALVPVYLKNTYSDYFKNTKTVYTIHNLAYQGLFPAEQWNILTLDKSLYNPKAMEYWNKISLMKAGIVFSDIITTVSETYAKEIQTEEYGCGLQGVLSERKDKIFGIVNGVDYDIWNPKKDKLNYKIKYTYKNFQKKKEKIKEKLLNEYNLPYRKGVPLVGVVSRLVHQKGFDILSEIIEDFMKLDLYFFVLGTGELVYHNLLQEIKKKYPDKVAIELGFNNILAHRIEAASDLFLMPSRYEPCGLNQIYSLKYGTLPIVRETGGLADTVKDGVTGFTFKDYSSSELFNTIKRAIDKFYNDKQGWNQMVINAMKQNWSWDESSKKYIELYYSLHKT